MKICDEEDCGNPSYDECDECSQDLCEDCIENCDWCKGQFCTTCLDEHLGDGCYAEPIEVEVESK